jgi:hypothetical protein
MAYVAWSMGDGSSYLNPAMIIGRSNRLRKRVQADTWSQTLNKRTSSVQFLILQRTIRPYGGECLAFRAISKRGSCWNWDYPPLIFDRSLYS